MQAAQLDQAKMMRRVTANHFGQLVGSEEVRHQYKVDAIPRYVLIDRKGTIIYSSTGYSEEIEAVLKNAL